MERMEEREGGGAEFADTKRRKYSEEGTKQLVAGGKEPDKQRKE